MKHKMFPSVHRHVIIISLSTSVSLKSIALEMGKNMSYPVHCRGQQYCCCPPKSVWATKHISLLCIVGHFVAECSSIWQLYRNSLAIIFSCSIIFFVVQIPCRLPYRPLLAKLVSPLRIPPLSWANIGWYVWQQKSWAIKYWWPTKGCLSPIIFLMLCWITPSNKVLGNKPKK